MPNIAVFRVSKRKNTKSRYLGILFITVLLIIVLWLLNRICTVSIMSLKAGSSDIIHAAGSTVFEGFIQDNLGGIKPVDINTDEKTISTTLNGLSKGIYPLEFIDCKNVFNKQFPMLQVYYSKYSKVINTDKGDNMNQPQSQIVKDKIANEDERETETGDNKNDKIYEQSTIVRSGNITIRNHTSYKIDIEKLKSEAIRLGGDEKKPQAVILHTHTSEAYTPSKKFNYKPSDPYRTEDLRYNVARVGKELNYQLSKRKIKSIHNTTMHDFPTYTGSYSRSLQTAAAALKKYPSAKIVLDIHRDALGQIAEQLRTAAKIENTDAARIMFVVGTDQLGLKHDNWRENLKFAIKLQDKANKLYPGLCKEIDLRKERFNQHVAPGALIVEVGGTGNTLEEALTSMKYLARIVDEVVKQR